MDDNLHDKPRKELKQLCNQFNIRTAGVKHDELVRMLRNKLYPPVPESPRSPRKSTKVSDRQSPAKENGEPDRTPKRSASQGRTLRNLLHENESPREAGTASRRKVGLPDSGLPRKPLLTKSNTTPSRRSDFLRKKVHSPSGVDKESQENAYASQASLRRLCQINGSSSFSQKILGAPGQPERTLTSAASSTHLPEDATEAQIAEKNTHSNSESGSPRISEADRRGVGIEPSDAGSDGTRSVSEIATFAGHDAMSESSDADEFRSVSSEPVSRVRSQGKRLSMGSESSKLSLCSLQSGLSFVTAVGDWGSGDLQSVDHLLKPPGTNLLHKPSVENIFPDFLEGTDFLAGDAELSFLDAGAADPEDLSSGGGPQEGSKKFDPLGTPMARNYVNYTRGTERGGLKEGPCFAGNTATEVTEGQAESHLNDEHVVDLPQVHEAEDPPSNSAQRSSYQKSGSDNGAEGKAGASWWRCSPRRLHQLEEELACANAEIPPPDYRRHGHGLDHEAIKDTSAPASSGNDGEDAEGTQTTIVALQDTDNMQIMVLTEESHQDVAAAGPPPENPGHAWYDPGFKSSNASDVRAPHGDDERVECAARPQDFVSMNDIGDEGRDSESGGNIMTSEAGVVPAHKIGNVDGVVEELKPAEPELEVAVVSEREATENAGMKVVNETLPPAQDSDLMMVADCLDEILSPVLRREDGGTSQPPSSGLEEHLIDGRRILVPVQDFPTPELVGDEGESTKNTTGPQHLETGKIVLLDAEGLTEEQVTDLKRRIVEFASNGVNTLRSNDKVISGTASPKLDEVVSDANINQYDSGNKMSELDKFGDTIHKNQNTDATFVALHQKDEIPSLAGLEEEDGAVLSQDVEFTRPSNWSTRADDVEYDDALPDSDISAETVDLQIPSDKDIALQKHVSGSDKDDVAARTPKHVENRLQESDLSSPQLQGNMVTGSATVNDTSADPTESMAASSALALHCMVTTENPVDHKCGIDVKAKVKEPEKSTGATGDMNKDQSEEENLQQKAWRSKYIDLQRRREASHNVEREDLDANVMWCNLRGRSPSPLVKILTDIRSPILPRGFSETHQTESPFLVSCHSANSDGRDMCRRLPGLLLGRYIMLNTHVHHLL